MNAVSEKPSDNFLPASSVWQRYGVTSMTLHRWLADPELEFPRPFYLGRFRFWRIAELEAWEAKQPRVPKPFVPASRQASAQSGRRVAA